MTEEEKKIETKKPYPYAFPPGRPSEFEPEMCAKVIELMSVGCSKVVVAARLGVSRETLYEWVRKHPVFADTMKRGEELSETWWQEEARMSLRDRDFNAGLWYMNMKNRFKWSDRQETTVNATVKQEDAIKELG